MLAAMGGFTGRMLRRALTPWSSLLLESHVGGFTSGDLPPSLALPVDCGNNALGDAGQWLPSFLCDFQQSLTRHTWRQRKKPLYLKSYHADCMALPSESAGLRGAVLVNQRQLRL